MIRSTNPKSVRGQTALVIATLLLAPALTVLMPSAEASHQEPTLAQPKIEYKWRHQTTFSESASNVIVGPEDTVRISVEWTNQPGVSNCGTGATTVTNEVTADLRQFGGENGVQMTPVGSTGFEIEYELETENQAAAEDSTKPFKVNITASSTCGGGAGHIHLDPLTVSKTVETSNQIKADVRPHQFSTFTTTIVPATQVTPPADAPAFTQAGVGGKVRLELNWPGLVDNVTASPIHSGAPQPKLELDLSDFGVPGGYKSYTPGAGVLVDLDVLEPNATIPTYDGRLVKIRVTDRAGNVGETSEALTQAIMAVDNKRPGQAGDPTVSQGNFRVNIHTMGGGNAYASFNWTYTSTNTDIVGATVTRVGDVPGARTNVSTVAAPAAAANMTVPHGQSHTFTLHLVDDAGNKAGVSSVTSTPHSIPRLDSLAFQQSGPLLITPADLKVIKATVTQVAPAAFSFADPPVYFYLRDSAGEYWDGNNDTDTPVFIETPKKIHNLNAPGLGQQFTLTNFTRKDTTQGMNFPSGTYILGFVVKDANGHSYEIRAPVRIDRTAPTSDTTLNSVVSNSIQQGRDTVFRLNVTEGFLKTATAPRIGQPAGDSGIARINFTIVDKIGKPVKSYIDAQNLKFDCTPCIQPLVGALLTGINSTTQGTKDGNLFEAFTTKTADSQPDNYGEIKQVLRGLPVGRHYVHLDAQDKAGNAMATWKSEAVGSDGGVIAVGPRLEPAMPAAGAAGSPYYLDANGNLHVHVWASHSNKTYTDSDGNLISCQQTPNNLPLDYYCPVTRVVIKYKSGNDYTTLATLRSPQPTLTGTATTGNIYYNYTVVIPKHDPNFPGSTLPVGFSTLEPILLQIEAAVVVPNVVSTRADWVYKSVLDNQFVKKPSGSGSTNLYYPKEIGAFNVTGAAGTIRFNATVIVSDHVSTFQDLTVKTPDAEYTLYNVRENKYLRLDGVSPGTFLAPGDANEAKYTATRPALLSRCKTNTCAGAWNDSAGRKFETPKYLYNFSLDAGRPNTDSIKVTQGSGATYKELRLGHWLNPVLVPDGEYLFNVTFRTNVTGEPAGTASQILGQTPSRLFRVESSPAVVRIDYDYVDENGTFVTKIFNEKADRSGTNWVNRSFQVRAKIDVGLANLVGTPTLALKRLTTFGTTSPWVSPTAPGMSLVVDDQETVVDATTGLKTILMNVTVNLPDEARHDSSYQLLFNVTTDLQQWGAPTSQWKVSGPNAVSSSAHASERRLDIRLDIEKPTFGFYSDLVNATGHDGGDHHIPGNRTQKVLFGTATDAGSGVASVEVRVVDVTANSTWGNRTRSWLFGVQEDEWSPARLVVRNITNDLWWAYGPDGAGMPTFESKILDRRFHEFRVDVRGVDKTGIPSGIVSYNFTFDGAKPKIEVPLLVELTQGTTSSPVTSTTTNSPPGSPTQVSYKGVKSSFTVSGRVSDDVCLSRVNLVFEMPNGWVERVPIASRAESTCTSPGANLFAFNLGAGSNTVAFPRHVLNQSGSGTSGGVYKAYLEAVDQSGKTTRDPTNYWFRVKDDYPAQLVNARFKPSPAGKNALATLEVDVFENHRMGRVEVRLFREDAFGSYDATRPIAFGNATAPRPADSIGNGTGKWSITTTAMNVTLEPGGYAAQVRVVDAFGQGESICPLGVGFRNGQSCVGVGLLVVDSGGPAVVIQSPDEDAEYSGNPVRVVALVSSPNVTADGISIRVGTNASQLASADVEVSEIVVNGARAGWYVYHNATVAEGTEEFFFNVTARDAAQVPGFADGSVRVDATPPNVTGAFDPVLVVDNVTFVGDDSRLTFNASDDVSGVASVVCSVDDGEEQACTGGFRFPATTSDGEYAVNFTAVDRAGNRGNSTTVVVVLDRSGPLVDVITDGYEVAVQVEDTGAGLDNSSVTVYYSTSGDAGVPTSYESIVATLGEDGLYHASLPADAALVRYYAEATDVLGNVGRWKSAAAPEAIGDLPEPPPENTAPTLVITSPAEGATVTGDVPIEWESSDADGDTVAVSISYAVEGGQPGLVQSDLDGALGTFTWSTSTRSDGKYTLTLRASDGIAVTVESVNFTLAKRTPFKIELPPQQKVTEGDAVQFQVRLDVEAPVKEVKAEYATPAGEVVATRTLAGANGVYQDTYRPSAAGTYGVRVIVAYDDGTPPSTFPVGAFQVLAAGGDPGPGAAAFEWTMQFVALVAMSGATMALAAYAAFVRWKR